MVLQTLSLQPVLMIRQINKNTIPTNCHKYTFIGFRGRTTPCKVRLYSSRNTVGVRYTTIHCRIQAIPDDPTELGSLFPSLLCGLTALPFAPRRQILSRQQSGELPGVFQRRRHAGGGGAGTPAVGHRVEPRDGCCCQAADWGAPVRDRVHNVHPQRGWRGDDGVQARPDAEGECRWLVQ